MMPAVVRIATTEQATMKTESACSTPLRARKRGARRARAKKSAEEHRGDARPTNIASRAMAVQRFSRSAAAATSGLGSAKMRPAATLWISESVSWICDGGRAGGQAVGQAAHQQAVDDAALEQQPEQHEDQRRHADPDRDEGAVVARQRVHRLAVGGDEAARRRLADEVGGERQREDGQEEIAEHRVVPSGGSARGARRGPRRRQLKRSIGAPAATAARTASRSASASGIRPRSGR